jgi:hypothetical protein
MKDLVEKEKEINIINRRESPRNQGYNNIGSRENDYKSSPAYYNNNNNANLLNAKGLDSNPNGKFKNTREFQEYIDSQKMLMELEKIKDGEMLEDNDDLEIYDYQIDNLKQFEDMNENNLILADFIDNNNDKKSYNYEMNYELNEISSNYNQNNPNNSINLFSSNYLENNIKCELESELGKDLFQKIYRILSENLNTNILSYDFENLNKKIKQECSNYDEIALDLSITRIPDIYCLIIKDRERK